MLRTIKLKTTQEIIDACNDAVQEYDDLCRTQWKTKFYTFKPFKPGKEGIDRRKEFTKLLKGITSEMQAEEAFSHIYLFYCSQKSSSNLIKFIKSKLKWVLGVPEPELTSIRRHGSDENAIRASNDLFYQMAKEIVKISAINHEKDEVPLMTRPHSLSRSSSSS